MSLWLSVVLACLYCMGSGRRLQPLFASHPPHTGPYPAGRSVLRHPGCRARATGMVEGGSEEHDAKDAAENAKVWLAPLVTARGLPDQGKLALGALELKADGLFWLYGQVFETDLDQWRPVILQRTGSDVWQGGGLSLQISIADIAAVTLPTTIPGAFRKLAPSWPQDLLSGLEAWPLKGPGTVIVDPHFFVQRGAYMALHGSGPVLFPCAAEVMGLPTEALIQCITEHIQGKTLSQVLCNQEQLSSFGDMLHAAPKSLVDGHFDLSRATHPGDKHADTQQNAKDQLLSIALHEKPVGLRFETKSWTCGAVVRGVVPDSEAECAGCRVGDIVYEVNGVDASQTSLDDIEQLLVAPDVLNLVLGRPRLSDSIYLREAVAHDDAMKVFAGDGASVAELVPTIAEHFGSRELYFSEQTPMVFAGDGGTSSHVHIDKKPLIQFCHILHGTKFFVVAPASERESGPVKPWLTASGDSIHGSEETVLPTNIELSPEAESWMQRSDVSVAAVRPGDLLLFQGHSIHSGSNAVGDLCVALFHGAQSIMDMAKGRFGPAYQALALRYVNAQTGA